MPGQIRKYVIETDYNDLPLHEGATFLAFMEQGGKLTTWWLDDPTAKDEPVEIFVYGTGFNVHGDKEHLGTIQDGSFVWHLFRTKK